MRYPGNAALSADVQQRIAESFQQALNLVAEGNEHEGKVGCEFILGMDPLFHPASTLLQRIAQDGRPVQLDELREDPSLDIASADVMVVDDPIVIDDVATDGKIAELDDLDLEGLDGAPLDTTPLVPPAPAPAPQQTTAGSLGAVLQDLIAQRNFEQVLQIAQSQQETIEASPDVQALVKEARSRLESAHYVDQFLESAEQARAAGRTAEADKLIAKAKVLDPEHPGLRDPAAGDTPVVQVHDTQRIPAVIDEPKVAAAEVTTPVSMDAPSSAMPALEDPLEALDEPASIPPAPAATKADPNEGDRVGELLDEGQEAFDRDDYQDAIDIWSRIFLIDIDNEEAGNRIEMARGRKAEKERLAEEVFHEGLGLLETQQLDEARAALVRVLELQPSHSVARDYLEQLDAGEVPTVAPAAERASATTALESDDFVALDPDQPEEGSPSLEEAVRRDRVVAVKRTDRRLLLLGGAVSVLVLATLGFLFTKWDDLFPNADNQPVAGGRQVPSQLDRATALHDKGNTEAAIRILESVAPGNPLHNQSQALLTQWRALIEEPAGPEVPTGPTPQEIKARQALIASVLESESKGHMIVASRRLARASEMEPPSPEELQIERRLRQSMEPLQGELALFEQSEWNQLIPRLWRKLDEEPNEPNIQLLISEAYHNLALRSLQRGDTKDAIEKLNEALSVAPDDQDLERLVRFAETYEKRPQDLLYRIFVKYLPARP